MELHLHLTVAFRALDRKWGPAIDLDNSDESMALPCLPAMVDRPATTFSSEEYLKKRYRPKPYSRVQGRRRKENVKTNDSFADISSSRIPNLNEVEATSMDSGLDEDCRTVTDLVEEFGCAGADIGSTTTLDSGLEEKRPVNRIFKILKSSTKSYLESVSKKIGARIS